jgi:predicted CXXCH cytochrome family protein
MRQKSVTAFIILCFIVLALIVLSVENGPHDFKQCSSCHVLAEPSRSSGVMARRMTEPITRICDNCHEKTQSEGYMHPCDVRPQRVHIPADMPLSEFGEITCSTCHDVHSEYTTPYGAPTRFLRRGETGKAFCKICHGNFAALSNGHSGSLGEAHFRSQYIETASRLELDPMSKNCLSCHDGSYATSATIKVGNWRHERELMRYDQGSHPIGSDYESVRLSQPKSDLIPLSMVDRRIRFFDGKVGCGSCHDPYSTIPKRLTISDEHSKLCFSCHSV